MKLIVLAICLPMVFGSIETELNSIFDIGALKTDSQILLDLVGPHFTEQDCRDLCHHVGDVLVHSCPAVCMTMQALKQKFLLTPHPNGILLKRALLGGLNLNALKSDLQALVNVAGSDPAEAVCENFLHNYIVGGGLIDTAVPFVCHSIQYLVSMLGIHPHHNSTVMPVTAAPGKRALLPHGFHFSDLFDLDSLKADMQMLVDVLGSDPTEHACEAECHKLIADGTVFAFGIPLICRSFQALLHTFHIHRDPTTTMAPMPMMTTP